MLSQQPVLMLFLGEARGLSNEFLELQKASIDLREGAPLTLAVAEVFTSSYAASLARLYGVNQGNLPQLTIFYQTHQETHQHLLGSELEISEENIKQFVQDYQKGLLD